jgi:Zn-dependent protease with chaperone function
MPIEINASEDVNELLSNSIARIKERIDNGIVDNVSIVVTDLKRIPILFPSNAIPNEFQFYSRILINSFGITQPKTFADQVRRHLLVLNITNIKSQNLTDSELDAVIAHELGHILNSPQTGIDNYNEQQEFYADYFAKSINLQLPLISSIEKYLLQENAQNRNLFLARIAALNSDEVFQGTIKAV